MAGRITIINNKWGNIMMKVAICEANNECSSRIENYIAEIKPFLEQMIQVDTYSSGRDFTRALEQNEAFQIVYLNLDLPDMDGISCAERLRERSGSRDTLLICLSRASDINPRIFDLQPFLYLPMPFERKTFTRKFLFAVETLQESDDLFVCKKGGTLYQVKKKDIILLESVGREIILSVAGGEEIQYRGTLKQEHGKFHTANFIRPHQSFLVNLDYVEQYGSGSLILCNHKYVPISELRTREVKQEILRFWEYRNVYSQLSVK